MADPLTIITTIGSTAKLCAGVAQLLFDLGSKYAGAKAAVCSLAAECSTTKVVLERLASLVTVRPGLLAPRPGAPGADLKPCFEMIVTSIRSGVGELERRIAGLSRGAIPGDMNFGHKLQYMLHDGSMKETVTDIREQRSTLSMLLACIQSETLDSIQIQLESRANSPQPSIPSSRSEDPSSLNLGQRLNVSNKPTAPKIRIMLKRESDGVKFQVAVAKFRPKPGRSRRTDQKYMQKLHMAIENADDMLVARLLLDRVDPSTPLGTSRLAPLPRAAYSLASLPAAARLQTQARCEHHRRIAIVTDLLAAGAVLDHTTETGASPLSLLCQGPHYPDLVAIACELGAHATSSDAKGFTPLHRVAAVEPLADGTGAELVKILVRFGADVDARTAEGNTPLGLAVARGCVTRVRQLLEFGADMAGKDGCSEALAMAIRWKRVEIATLLCSHGAFPDGAADAPSRDLTCLMLAAAQRNVELAQVLLEAGADPNLADEKGRVPLVTATSQRDLEMVKLLLKHKADVKLSAKSSGRVALHYAEGNLELLNVLLDAGFPIDPVDNGNKTPLTYAVAEGLEEAAQLLLERGADADHQVTQPDGKTTH